MNRLCRHGFVCDQLPAILWALLIFVASSISNVTLPEIKFVPSDKVVHLAIYLVLCALVNRACMRQTRFPALSRHSLLVAVISTILYGLSDEFHQSFVPNRDASIGDVAADSLGAVIFLFYARWRKPR